MNSSGTANSSGAGAKASGVGLNRRLLMLMQPGIGIKRWLAFGVFGVLLTALGIAFAVSVSLTNTVVEAGRVLTFGKLLGGVWRGAIFGGIGLTISGVATYMLYKRVAFGARYSQGGAGVIANLINHRVRSGGPKIVAIGGGTGLSSLLRGLKAYTDNITAIVTVADDGGSSGRLRAELGISPPGDARQCLIALSESEPLMEEMLSYRFESGAGLEGHSLGNLLLAALVHTRGSFNGALAAAGVLLAVRGQVMPSSVSSELKLMARTTSGRTLEGESAIGKAGEPIEAVWIEPADCPANPSAIEAIEDADAIVIGPGSLYTSILPNFLVPGIGEAVANVRVPKLFVCNIATQYGETDGLSGAEHLRVFHGHTEVVATHFLVNDHPLPIGPEHHQEPVLVPDGVDDFDGVVVRKDLIDASFPSRHDSYKLSAAVYDLARAGIPANTQS